MVSLPEPRAAIPEPSFRRLDLEVRHGITEARDLLVEQSTAIETHLPEFRNRLQRLKTLARHREEPELEELQVGRTGQIVQGLIVDRAAIQREALELGHRFEHAQAGTLHLGLR